MSFLDVFALRVEQPLCDFYIASLKASDLLKITFSEKLQYQDEKGKLHGSQRKIDHKRLVEIGRYIDSVEMAFPNSIILAVNYNEEGELVNDEAIRWDIHHVDDNLYRLRIPSHSKLAAIIDGQHRMKGFEDPYLKDKSRLDVELPCSIFFDLPNSYQAFLFATINGNQKKVDKSLALEQFGFNVEDEPQHSWNPEKLAVYFTRRLNFTESPLKGHIKIAPTISSELHNRIFSDSKQWSVSTATIVDGILNLISTKPKRDRVEMAQENIWGKRSRSMVKPFKDSSPLRSHFLDKEDEVIYKIISTFLKVAKDTIWKEYNSKSYIYKTVGVQAVFDLLRRILEKEIISEEVDFYKYLKNAVDYDFTKDTIQASGIGRKDIRNALLYAGGLISNKDLKSSDLDKVLALKR
ncbi:DNA phosphorothioation-associated DGQHR protein 1 [Pontibacter indicus]|uniref:DNA phosphorothioation-associated DGQHR protein 1 n=1 Tax=Pontibacter indicus TaxID=1317125 RepID=A0A1R3WUF4_9BACT|nr:DNA phosphorothioation-associated DGQHR protein 1 [Pontibacter indicus]SIT81967.1 DNA phosphorothioation-associated DGQHR protein 1 [Pontibacter indicus]